MTRPDAILPEREKIERLVATAPDLDVWVSANAGSGKTTILRNRVVRLLLEGTEPNRILCLTYTKAAAAEMQSRIFEELAKWVDHDDEKLARTIAELVGAEPEDISRMSFRMRRARQLFAQAVETPGGLKIQTIHAFCERLLHHFPIEAGVSTDFQVLDDVESRRLKQEARATLVLTACENPQSALGQAFERILGVAGYGRYETALEEAIEGLRRARANADGVPSGQTMPDQDYAESFGIGLEQDEQGLDRAVIAAFREQIDLIGLGDVLVGEKPNKNNDHLIALVKESQGQARIEALARALRDVYFVKKESAPRSQLASAAFKTANSGLYARLEALRPQFETWQTQRRAASALHNSRMLRLFAEAVLERYSQAKAERNGLDYDDLILHVRMLLGRGSAAWVMMKLDAAIEHILVDEAQDTTPDMWRIVRALCDDFHSGEGQSRRRRTLFVVGDEKQSIFSFQGARPEVFGDIRQELVVQVPKESRIANPVRLTSSFRSSPDVLGAVDRIFETPDRRDGLTAEQDSLEHRAANEIFPGRVELWPLEPGEPAPGDPDAAIDAAPPRSAEAMAAERIAKTISGWFAQKERFLSDGKPIGPGDILILVQQRLGYFDQILRALKNHKIPVAGADRLAIHADIAVQDLMGLARVALLPSDDLSLATLLKSPLFGISEGELQALCRGRGGDEAPQGLREHLRALSSHQARYRIIDEALARYESRARRLDPFRFYAQLLAEDAPLLPGISGRRAFYRRLGPECADALDAFLAEARRFSAEPGAHLQLFLADQETRKIVIKREMDQSHSEVRVMTVHSAKGLEARIVILADCTRVLRTQREKTAFLAPGSSHDLLVWSVTKGEDPDLITHQRELGRKALYDEYRRLFYVGLTRAKDRLCLTGVYQPPRKEPPLPALRSWYDLANDAFRDAPGLRIEQQGTTEDMRDILCFGPVEAPFPTSDEPNTKAQDKPILPDWARRAAPPAPEVMAPFRPSRIFETDMMPETDVYTPPQAPERLLSRPFARRRGILIHRLFEILPIVPSDQRKPRALALLKSQFGTNYQEGEAILPSILAFLDAPAGQDLFGAASQAERAVSGTIRLSDGTVRKVIARIDRLVIGKTGVLVFDLKSGKEPEAPSRSHLAQIALYAHLAAGLYPGRMIEAGLFYTDTLTLRRIDAAKLAQALEHVTLM